jgi:hypothetical protein
MRYLLLGGLFLTLFSSYAIAGCNITQVTGGSNQTCTITVECTGLPYVQYSGTYTSCIDCSTLPVGPIADPASLQGSHGCLQESDPDDPGGFGRSEVMNAISRNIDALRKDVKKMRKECGR